MAAASRTAERGWNMDSDEDFRFSQPSPAQRPPIPRRQDPSKSPRFTSVTDSGRFQASAFTLVQHLSTHHDSSLQGHVHHHNPSRLVVDLDGPGPGLTLNPA